MAQAASKIKTSIHVGLRFEYLKSFTDYLNHRFSALVQFQALDSSPFLEFWKILRTSCDDKGGLSCYLSKVSVANGEKMLKFNLSKNTIRKIIKVSCVIQLVNASMDYFLWVTVGYRVPSFAIATLIAGYSVILLAYDKLVS